MCVYSMYFTETILDIDVFCLDYKFIGNKGKQKKKTIFSVRIVELQAISLFVII